MKWYRNLKIGMKILILTIIMSSFLVVMGGIGLYQVQKEGEVIQSMYEGTVLPIELINDSRVHLYQNTTNLLRLIFIDDATLQKQILQDIDKNAKEYNQHLTEYRKQALDVTQKEKLSIIDNAVVDYRNYRTDVLKLTEQKKTSEAFQKYLKMEKSIDQINLGLDQLSEYEIQKAEQINELNKKESDQSSLLVLFTIISFTLLSIVIGSVISRLISRPLTKMVNNMDEIAKGNLRIAEENTSYHDEVGNLETSLRTMVKNLKDLISHVSESSEKVAASAEELSASTEQNKQATSQIASSIQEVSSGADTQVKEIEEMMNGIETLSREIQRLAETSNLVSAASRETAEAAKEGNESIHLAVTKLTQRSEEIDSIVDLITGVSDQTHLLALNAAIEAAHAGEHGKGFAVVASEVKKLAEQTKNSANQIAKLIKEVQVGMVDIEKIGEAFQIIVNRAQDVAEQIGKVSVTSKEMATNTEEINKSVEQMGEIAKESAANTQNVASASEEQLASFQEVTASADGLGHMAFELQQLVAKFKL